MCSQYTVKTRTVDIATEYGIKMPEPYPALPEKILPHREAPVILRGMKNELVLSNMFYSLIPSWSREAKLKFTTHNARIESIAEKATWKIPFARQHCIVPMTGFFESVYDGPFAGHMIELSPTEEPLLFAAGVFDLWKGPEKTIKSFSVITTVASEFIANNGHDRSPLFLNFEKAKEWLHLSVQPKEMVDFLIQNNQKPLLQVSAERALNPGWEKRKHIRSA